jgi:pilus assembly protein CpaB
MTLAVVCALGATLAWHVFFNGLPSDQSSVVMVPVAAQNIPAMSVIDKTQIVLVEMPAAEVSKLNIVTSESDIVGKRIFEGVEQKSPFLKSNIQSEESQAPFYLPEGYRAITLANSPLIGVAGYLEPGMYVDILWTYDAENANKQKVTRTAVALQNVKVLAVNTAGAATVQGGEASNTVTLMVKLNEAKWLTLMAETGKMKLALRPSSTEQPDATVPKIIPENGLPAELTIIEK